MVLLTVWLGAEYEQYQVRNAPSTVDLYQANQVNSSGIVNGEIAKTNVMKVTLSCDHRVVDGVVGSKFLNTLKELLEEPVKMLV